MAKFCIKCGAVLPSNDASFCAECGTAVAAASTTATAANGTITKVKTENQAQTTIRCSTCDIELAPGATNCPLCGRTATAVVADPSNLKNGWLYALGFAPLVIFVTSLILSLAVGATAQAWLGYVVAVIVNTVFLVLDQRELRKVGLSSTGLFVLGFTLVPIYLFMRGKKAKKYLPAIIWCVLFAANLVITNVAPVSNRLSTTDLAVIIQAEYVKNWREQGMDIVVTKALTITHKSGNSYSGVMTVSYFGMDMQWVLDITYDGKSWTSVSAT